MTETKADSKPKAGNSTLRKVGVKENGFTLIVDGKEVTSIDFDKQGPKGVTIYGYDSDTDTLIYTCPRTRHNENWYASAPTKVAGIRADNPTIAAAVKAANKAEVRPISLQGITKLCYPGTKERILNDEQIKNLKTNGTLKIDKKQFDALRSMYGQMHILEAGKPAKQPKGKTEPAPVTSPVPQAEVDAAKAAQKSGWDKFCDHMKAHWWKYLLALITIGVIGYFGFRKGGWWNKKSRKTPATTPPTVPGGLEGNGGSKPDSNSNDISSLTQGALLGMTKVDAPAMSDNGEVIGRGGIPTRTY